MIYESTLFSIIFQAITSLIDIYGLTIPVADNYNILKQLLEVELGVQVIELIFYIWLISAIHSVKNITTFRYADWFITTPIMLITLMAYMAIETNKKSDIWEFLDNNKDNVLIVIFLNILMLFAGLLAEFYPLYRNPLVLAGFVPFAMYFYKIYKDYLKPDVEREEVHPFFTRGRLFWYFVVTWSLYGVAALMPYVWKNTALNILDLIAKNGFGLMLVAIISYRSV